MGDISEHFSRSEFACKCQCGFDTVDVELIYVLSALRSALGPTKINSGCRCHDHNRAVGGVKDSQHVLGRAADIVVKDVPPDEVADYLEEKYPNQYGIGRYNTFTHIDTRGARARW